MKVKTAKVLGILISVLVLFASCGQLAENGGESQVTISLPYVAGANSRAIDPGKKDDLIKATRSYRVHMNNTVLEGTGGNFSSYFMVGLKLDIYVECVNGNGEVILRTVTKSIVVGSGRNSVSFNLMADGTEIIPASQNGRVTYTYGDADAGGAKSGLPTDSRTYRTGDTFTVQDGTPDWEHADTFTGWKSSVQLTPADGGSETSTPVANSDYIMPEGGVTLVAQWTPKTYTINYDTAITTGTGSPQQASGGAASFTMAEKDDRQLSSTSDSTGANTFMGWATASGADTANITGTADIRKAVTSGSLQIGGNNNVTLYAVWTNLPTHVVTFDDSQLQGQEYWQGNSSNTVNVIDGQSVTAHQIQLFLTGGAKSGYTLTYSGSGSSAINSQSNADAGFTIQASKVTFSTTYTVTIDFSGVSNEAWWQTGSPTTATKSVAKGSQVSASDIQTEINSRKKTNYNVTYNGGNKTISSASDINVAITASELDVKELFIITYDWGSSGVNVTSGTLPQTQSNIVQGTSATVTIPTVQADYTFLGWSETDGADSATYNTGNKTIPSVTQNYTLYAVWARTVLYDTGLLVINELVANRKTDATTAVYDAMLPDGSNYVFPYGSPWDGDSDSITSVEIGSDISPTSTRNWFYGMLNCTSIDLTKLDTSRVTDMYYMFYYCSSLISLDVRNFDTSSVTNMRSMFDACSSLQSLDLSSFNTYNVTTMYQMFYGCSSLKSLDLSNFNTSRVTTMFFMFFGCSSLTRITFGKNFDTSSVTSMYQMFKNCSSLSSIIFGTNFNTSSVRTMYYMFSDCSQLDTIYASNDFDIANVTNSDSMFARCSALRGGQGTLHNPTIVDKTYARIDGGTDAPGSFTEKQP